jgi:hypothetical protein
MSAHSCIDKDATFCIPKLYKYGQGEGEPPYIAAKVKVHALRIAMAALGLKVYV